MRIAPITTNLYINNNIQSREPFKSTPPPHMAGGIDTVSFGARISDRFPKEFLREILHYGLPCPICNRLLIPLDFLNEPAIQSLKIFKPYKKKMTPINQVIYTQLTEIAPTNPRKNIQELLQILHKKAEKNLIQEQTAVLDELVSLNAYIPSSQLKTYVELIKETKAIMQEPQTKPVRKRFKRKNVIKEFDDFALSLKKDNVRVAIMNTIRKLPTSENSRNAFIVKYASRSPEEIGMKLYKNPFGTMEHLIPESQGGKIIIWECSEDNGARGDAPLNEILKENPQQIKENFQKHFNRLIEIYHDNEVSPYLQRNKELLKEYIFTARNEAAIASKEEINVDISALGTIPQYIIIREIQRIKEMGNTNYLRKLYKMLQDKQ